MGGADKRRTLRFSSSLHQDVFLSVVLASFVPLLLLSGVILYISIVINNSGALAQNVFADKAVIWIILTMLAAPVAAMIMLLLCFLVTAKIVGPLDRITREINENIQGKRSGPIIVRDKDKLSALVEAINALLAAKEAKKD